jgi:hypothetical protein
MVHKVREAARFVYTTGRYEKRGEFGELILHALLRHFFETSTAVNKLYFKDSSNDTVKGFDAVHVSQDNEGLKLWLGEAKFYKSLTAGIRDALDSIEEHLDRDFLRSEFAVIMRRLDEEQDWVADLRELLHRNRPLDEIFSQVVIPIMVTYDSVTVGRHTEPSEEYGEQFDEEIAHAQKLLAARELPKHVSLVGFFVPLLDKETLVEGLDRRLKSAQEM